jgi:eukaryotic-like serine/threonine-protein kinase
LPLTPGTRLGPYEITSPIGEGGMGAVYRATDTNLSRQVAIKVLPDAFAQDGDRLARFEREAKTLASLNHPHIAAIYGFEKSGGMHAPVMELVEGDDLSQRIALGAIPLDEALPIAKQIAEALEAAHEQGIVHRDLKPANIKLRPDGAVKVLDFGLAKALELPSAASANVTASPTITSPAAMTGVGVILGTAAYMAPEQAKGRPADKRADIWAMGCVLYEMVTGRRAFGGEDVAETLAHILTKEPDWTALPASTPAPIRRLLRRCLEKDRRRRLADAADARLEMDEALASSGDASAMSLPTQKAAWGRALPWAVVGILGAGLALVLVLWAPWRQTVPPGVTRTTITHSGAAGLTQSGFGRDIALSPDGRRLVYSGNNGTQLFVRALDALEPVAITTGTGGAGLPFLSPDGQWVGFANTSFEIRKVAITGGAAQTITRLDGILRGATWAADDTIIFATDRPGTGLQRVSAGGGKPAPLTRPDRERGEAGHLWPELLPGGHAVLFTITSQTGDVDAAQVAVLDLRTETQKILEHGTDAHYVSSGHLVYMAAGAVRAIPFDVARLETRGTSVSMMPLPLTTAAGAGNLAIANDGTLVYVDLPGGVAANARTLVWVDRTGKEEAIDAPPRAYLQPRLSPDGKRIAVWTNDQTNDISIWDLERKMLTPLTRDPGEDQHPLWTRDGKGIIFSSNRGGMFNLWRQATDGTGEPEQLTKSSGPQFATGITPDGTAVVFFESKSAPVRDLNVLQLALDETHRVTPLLMQEKVHETEATVSPNGQWLAYESTLTGSKEIYVRPFPNVNGPESRVSTAGGTRPLWAPSGKELFYVAVDGSLLQVSVEAKGATLNNRAPTKLFERRYYVPRNSGRSYDVSLDGQRFLMIKGSGTDASPALILVQHWDEELKRLVPKK